MTFTVRKAIVANAIFQQFNRFENQMLSSQNR